MMLQAMTWKEMDRDLLNGYVEKRRLKVEHMEISLDGEYGPCEIAGSQVWLLFFFSSRRRHTRFDCDWSSDVCSSDLKTRVILPGEFGEGAHAVFTMSRSPSSL